MANAHLESKADRVRLESVSSRLTQPYIDSVSSKNQRIWENSDHWKLGFYFGYGDSRLWVPRKGRDGQPRSWQRVINFGHPIGEEAFPVLVAAYLVFAVIAAFLIAIAFGLRW